MIRRAALISCVLMCTLVAAGAHGKLCGDDVEGQDIPCACGDIVVSNVRLTNDPVLSTVCPGNGLVVRAPSAAAGVTIDLAGQSLRGSGHGTGVWIVHGGRGGARITSTGSRAQIDGFRDGIVGRGPDSVALISGLAITRSRRDGVRVDAQAYAVEDTEVRDAGRNGFGLSGNGFRATQNRVQRSRRFGFLVQGANGVLGTPGAGNIVEESGDAGFKLTGMGHRVVDCAVSGARKTGVRLNGMHYALTGCVAENNGGDGISGMGMDVTLAGNRADNNAGNGLSIRGMRITDGGGNRASGNLGLGQQRPPIQCAVNSAPCQP